MKGWLVNNCLTCIPGVETFWHDLLNWFPGLEAKMTNKTTYAGLVSFVENEARRVGSPDYIIRNASYFGKLNIRTKTVSYLQDRFPINHSRRLQQLDVCNASDIVVCNSPFIYNFYKEDINTRVEVIPIGTDFDLFRPLANKEELRGKWNIPENTILFVGAASAIKGFSKVLELISTTGYNYCLVMKDDYTLRDNRVKVFNQICHRDLVEIINCCEMLICTSTTESLHLAGVEAAACGLPVVTTDVGIYHGWESGSWGLKVIDGNFAAGIAEVFSNPRGFSPRKYFLEKGLDRETCKKKWLVMIS